MEISRGTNQLKRSNLVVRAFGLALWTLFAVAVAGCGSDNNSLFLPAKSGGQFAYVTNTSDDIISEFKVSKNGSLKFLAQIHAGEEGGLTGLATTPSGQFLYAAEGPEEEVYGFSINQKNGKLKPTDQVSVDTPEGSNPSAVVVDPSSRYLYVTDTEDDTILEYSIDQTSGALTPIGDGSVASTEDPVSIAVDPFGQFVYVANTDGFISVYPVSLLDGSLGTPVTYKSLGATSGTPLFVAIDASGAHLYVADALDETVTLFDVASGVLTFVNTVSTGVEDDSLWLAIDPLSRFLYSANFFDSNLTQFTVAPADGTLTSVGTVSNSDEPRSAVIDTTASFLYTTNFTTGTLSQFSIDQGDGDLTPIGSGTVDTEKPANGESTPFQIVTITIPVTD